MVEPKATKLLRSLGGLRGSIFVPTFGNWGKVKEFFGPFSSVGGTLLRFNLCAQLLVEFHDCVPSSGPSLVNGVYSAKSESNQLSWEKNIKKKCNR